MDGTVVLSQRVSESRGNGPHIQTLSCTPFLPCKCNKWIGRRSAGEKQCSFSQTPSSNFRERRAKERKKGKKSESVSSHEESLPEETRGAGAGGHQWAVDRKVRTRVHSAACRLLPTSFLFFSCCFPEVNNCKEMGRPVKERERLRWEEES